MVTIIANKRRFCGNGGGGLRSKESPNQIHLKGFTK